MMGTVRQMEDLTEYDAIAVCGGDGIVHEVVNGILTRSDWDVASKIPIIIIPAGKVNFQAKSLHLTHPLISAVSLLHPSPVPRTVLGLTTMSGLRVFSHSQVRWLPPPKFSHSWTSFLLSQRPDPNIPTRFGLHHFPPPSTSTEKTPRAAPPKRNQPGPPLHHPCLAPSSLPLGWNSAAFGSPLIVSAPPPTPLPTSPSPSATPQLLSPSQQPQPLQRRSHRPSPRFRRKPSSLRSLHLIASRCLHPSMG
ncbi:hypothetical protein BC829DRAFT_284201 [Chytridium lagenaria]|nr:hypothetical protein BC829DRAFT_284201 [Chytridium lagenaria]